MMKQELNNRIHEKKLEAYNIGLTIGELTRVLESERIDYTIICLFRQLRKNYKKYQKVLKILKNFRDRKEKQIVDSLVENLENFDRVEKEIKKLERELESLETQGEKIDGF